MYNEEHMCRILNEKRQGFKCWVITPLNNLTTAFTKPWLFLVQPPENMEASGFPTMTDRFKIDMVSNVKRGGEEYSLVHIPAIRIPNPFESFDLIQDTRIKAFAAYKVDVPRSWTTSEGDHTELDLMSDLQISRRENGLAQIVLEESEHQILTIEWDVTSVTFDAELDALRFFTEEKRLKDGGPTLKSQRAFDMIQNFHSSWKDFYDLHKDFPQLRNPELPRYAVPGPILQRFKAFNKHHKNVFDGLKQIPNGLYFLNGCPGSGKTEWNMILAGLVQYDAASRYYSLCREAGVDLRIVRMHGWPLEMRQSSKLHGSQPTANQHTPSVPDFTNHFLVTAGLSKQTNMSRDLSIVPTLDQASWEYFEKNKKDVFPGLQNLLDKMDSGEALTTDDWKRLRSHVSRLYRAVLAQTDFIATTPVAAYGRFSKIFKPDLIFVDEASHARELTTLIPLAYFTPKAWIFTGDVKQTQPFVKDAGERGKESGLKFNPFAAQLKLSTMARADHVNAINNKLLVNKRAFGNLHRLPSALFYDGQMTSGYDIASRYPDCVVHLTLYLQSLSGNRQMDENRIIVNMEASNEEKGRESYWNPIHHQWVLTQAALLLQDDGFRGLKHRDMGGTIMIATPYSTAVKQYHAAVKYWPEAWQGRTQVLTVDKAQGNEADVVFLDLVRTTTAGFMDDPKRLNVAITRARQAEIIVMRRAMAYIPGKRLRKSNYLSQVWDDTLSHNRIVTIS
ncbi:hypothetical protein NOR_04884 [Metarhizium rileyi]|uniref:Uncharacterized protein n=1 Tax=Metarhizium rileyi (strain RCEF 4871) TaxID=1649241 RepID=A0A162JJ23_METRR|nr:hypothetical protein NOR_04884 [Metarhizium rileyi RCEF 4871]